MFFREDLNMAVEEPFEYKRKAKILEWHHKDHRRHFGLPDVVQYEDGTYAMPEERHAVPGDVGGVLQRDFHRNAH